MSAERTGAPHRRATDERLAPIDITCVLLVALSTALCSGCEFLRSARAPIDGHHVRIDPYLVPRCLLVLLPGIGDSPEVFFTQGVIEMWEEADVECDMVMLDAHFAYYREQNLSERLRDDVLLPARERGYRTIWILGISIGGYGALWSTSESPGLVDGVVLVAPMIGVPPRAASAEREIRDAGGLLRWSHRVERAPRHHFGEPRVLWAWLAHACRTPDAVPVYLAFGDDDPSSSAMELLADALPPSRVTILEGGHDWRTWRTLLQSIFRSAPWRAHGRSVDDARR